MRAHERQAAILALAALDAALLLWATSAALAARYGVPGWPGGHEASTAGLALLLAAPALTLALMAVGGLYRLDELFSGHREYAGVARSCTYAAFAVLTLSFMLDVHVSRGALLLEWGFACLLALTGRFALRRLVFALRRRGHLVRRALVVGTDEHAVTIARQVSNDEQGWRVVGFLDDYQPVGAEVVDGLCVLGDPGRAPELAEAFDAGELIVVPHAVSWEAQRDLLELAAACDRPSVRLAPGLYHLLAAGARPLDANYVPLLTLERLRITGLDASLKRALDCAVALAAAPAVAGLCAALWAAARVSGGGPVLARRRALGRRGEAFALLALAAPDEAQRRDWAWRLRARAAEGRLAKLPNVLNILAGRMSLVGPRALADSPELLQRPWARTLLQVRPGLTGPPVVSEGGWGAEEQAIRDVAYVREYSLWLDLRLLFASLRRAARRERPLPASYHGAALERGAVEP